MSSQESVHDSPVTVTPELGKGTRHLAVPWSVRWSDSEAALSRHMSWTESVSKSLSVGCYGAPLERDRILDRPQAFSLFTTNPRNNKELTAVCWSDFEAYGDTATAIRRVVGSHLFASRSGSKKV